MSLSGRWQEFSAFMARPCPFEHLLMSSPHMVVCASIIGALQWNKTRLRLLQSALNWPCWITMKAHSGILLCKCFRRIFYAPTFFTFSASQAPWAAKKAVELQPISHSRPCRCMNAYTDGGDLAANNTWGAFPHEFTRLVHGVEELLQKQPHVRVFSFIPQASKNDILVSDSSREFIYCHLYGPYWRIGRLVERAAIGVQRNSQIIPNTGAPFRLLH